MAGPANQAIPRYKPDDDLTGHCTAAVTGKRFVGVSAAMQVGWAGLSSTADGGNVKIAHAGAGTKALGVAGWDGAIGDKILILRGCAVPVKTAANITAGAQVEVGTNGQAIPLASGIAVGYALDTSVSGADNLIWVY